MTTSSATALLEQLGACPDSIEWSAGMTTRQAWEKCRKPQWMLWALAELRYNDDRVLREYACWCVRQVWHLLTDPRSRAAVEVAERYARGEATAEELAAARAAAYAARAAAYAARATAHTAYAARAAAYAARAAADDPDAYAYDAADESAYDAIDDAATEAAWAATYATDADETARAAVYKAARIAQADRLREVVPCDVVADLIAAMEVTE